MNRGALLFLLFALAVQWQRSETTLRISSLVAQVSRSIGPPAVSSQPSRVRQGMAPYDQFILFGDSLIQHSSSQERGFALTPALQAEYIRRLDVVNRGFSGYNTDQALKILPQVIPSLGASKVRFLLVLFGANDACLEGAEGSQHVPLERFKKNLVGIVNHPLVKAQNPRIILVTPPPMNEYLAEESDRTKGIFKPRRKAEHTRLYASAVKEISQSHNVALLDLWECFMMHSGWSEGQDPLPGSKRINSNSFLRMLLHDGLHLTGVAYTIFQQELMRVIARTWPDQMPEAQPFVLPVWNEPSQWESWESSHAL